MEFSNSAPSIARTSRVSLACRLWLLSLAAGLEKLMPLYQAIVLAIIQGLTEFLPVSSTAHLALFPWLLHWKDPGLTFDVALHAGTLVAVVVYFWRVWLEMFAAAAAGWRSWLRSGGAQPDSPGREGDERRQKSRMLWYLIVGTVPAGVAGLLFEHSAENQLRRPDGIGVAR